MKLNEQELKCRLIAAQNKDDGAYIIGQFQVLADAITAGSAYVEKGWFAAVESIFDTGAPNGVIWDCQWCGWPDRRESEVVEMAAVFPGSSHGAFYNTHMDILNERQQNKKAQERADEAAEDARDALLEGVEKAEAAAVTLVEKAQDCEDAATAMRCALTNADGGNLHEEYAHFTKAESEINSAASEFARAAQRASAALELAEEAAAHGVSSRYEAAENCARAAWLAVRGSGGK